MWAMLDLLKRCLRTGEAEAWGDLYLVLLDYVLPVARQILLLHRFSLTDADDVFQEIVAGLYRNNMRKLRGFRGTSPEQLHNWLSPVAGNDARKWIVKERARQQESAALAKVIPWRMDEVTEQAANSVLDDFRAVLSAEDRERLDVVTGRKSATVAERTLRRRRKDLEGPVPAISSKPPSRTHSAT
jgi:DNA-directed RNA polymerase specialized sigma24 family protein